MATEILRPNAAGDETSIWNQFPASGEHWDKVDESIADDDDTYIYENELNQRDLYELPPSSGSGTINFIKIHFRVRKDGGVQEASPSLKSDDTVTDGTAISVPWVYGDYSEQWNNNPADEEPWEWSDIDDLQIGMLLSASGGYWVYCTQVYVEVDYTEVVGTNMQINIADVFKDISEIKINIGDVWKAVTEIKINIGDVWKTIFSI